MRTPCEWTISEFVPRVKSKLAQELNSKHGKNQKEIAKLLGVSQARVSQYIKKDNEIQRPLENGPLKLLQSQMKDVITRTVEKLVEELTQGVNPAFTIPTICSGCRELRTGNALCTIHKFDYKDLGSAIGNERNCDLCLKWKTVPVDSNQSIEQLEGRIDTLKSLENLVSELLLKIKFLDFIPQIGAQVCMFNAKSSEDLRNVAGYPGRIIKYQDQAKVVSNPQYNVSKTTANFLLMLRKYFNSLTTVLSIKNSFSDFSLLKESNFTVFITNEGDKKGFISQVESQINHRESNKLAILDSGSVGYEPIAYFFVSNPHDLLDFFD